VGRKALLGTHRDGSDSRNEKKKGYGLLVTKALAKEIVEEGQASFCDHLRPEQRVDLYV
jgi:hypothetical protein